MPRLVVDTGFGFVDVTLVGLDLKAGFFKSLGVKL
jgi:hypothetical protein